ncbi:MAG: hypothetical protein ABSH06_29240 [Thermodesulfobacteriota bacterium]
MFNTFNKKEKESIDYCKKEFGGYVYKITISLRKETWEALDSFVNIYNKIATEIKGTPISPALYGWLILAGLIKVRVLTRSTGNYFEAIFQLMQEFEAFEQQSQSFMLCPKTTNINRYDRTLHVLLPDKNAYDIINNTSAGWIEINRKVTIEMARGLYMLFGLWELKKIYLSSGNPIRSMKLLLRKSADSEGVT